MVLLVIFFGFSMLLRVFKEFIDICNPPPKNGDPDCSLNPHRTLNPLTPKPLNPKP